MTRVSHQQKGTSYSQRDLWYDTTYYWKVVARDKGRAEKESPRWNFRTLRPSISGTVADGETDDPVPGCTVLLFSGNEGFRQTRSDIQGRYGFDGLQTANYYLIALKKGYEAEYCPIPYEGTPVTKDLILQSARW